MPDIQIIIGHSGQIFPSTENDAEYFRKKKYGSVLSAKFKEPRNGKFHRLYFALLNVAFGNQDKYDNFEDFRVECQLRAGHYKEHITLKGKTVYVPMSIAYDKLDNEEFKELYQKALNVILKHFLNGTTEQELQHEINQYLGFM